MSKKDKKIKSQSRRRFIARAGLGTIGVLALGTYVGCNTIRRKIYSLSETLVPPYNGSGTDANLWFEITNENKVILHSPKVEMGQGTFTGFAQIVADELDVDIDQISVVAAATDTGIIDGMSTGGSLSIASLFTPLREMAATMRETIKAEAAKKLGVDSGSLKTSKGMIQSGGKTISFAEAVAGVTDIKLAKTPELRPISQYKHIGKPVPRIDLRAKVMGDPIFGMDAEMPDMVHASIIRSEHIGSSIKDVDTSQAENMPGNIKIVKKNGWIGIAADTFAQALAAKNKVKVEWDIPEIWSEQKLRDFVKIGEGAHMVTQKSGTALDPDEDGVFSMNFTSPIGAHAQIEPNGALASVKDGKATVILSTQVIGVTQKQVAKALGFDKENVNIIGTYLGGGFGRRLNTEHAVNAALMSQEIGRPVKYFFTRKEEFQNDAFRPPTEHIVRGKLNDKGNLEALEHHYASGDVAINSVLFPDVLINMMGTDVGAMRGGNIMYKNIPNYRAEQWHRTLPFATSFWRSLGLLANTFAIESYVDEMAIKAGKDPAEFRLSMLGEDENGKRIKKVIQEAVAKSGYTDKVSGNRAMGLAASIDAGSPCAQVVEVSITDNQIKVEKVTCVLDCGLAVNPDQVIAQCEGCIIMGISSSLYEKMTIKDGRLYPINYGSYQMALMKNSPKEINVHLIQSSETPLPVGEPPLGPIGAAIGNAVRRITGNRLTDLPMKLV